MALVTKSTTSRQGLPLPAWYATCRNPHDMISAMALKQEPARRYLYIKEWFDHFGLSDAKVAGRVGVERETVYRWRTEQNRLDPEKIAKLAHAISIQPEQFWRRPGRMSLDALVRNESDDLISDAANIISILKSRRNSDEGDL